MIDLTEARALCSNAEWNLVQSSFAPLLEMPANLKSKIDSVRKLYRKCTVIVRLQHSDSRRNTTLRKIELFAETIRRLEAALHIAEAAQGERPVGIHDEGNTLTEIALPGRSAPPERRDSRIFSALARRGEQGGQKFGSTRSQSHVGSIPRRQQGRRNSSKNH